MVSEVAHTQWFDESRGGDVVEASDPQHAAGELADLLITQRSRVRILPPLPRCSRSEAWFST